MINLEYIYPKPDKYLLILKDGKESILNEAREVISKKLFANRVKDRSVMIDFMALEIIDIDNDFKINNEMVNLFKNSNNIENNWLRWSLALQRDAKDLNLVNSGIEIPSRAEMQAMFRHKTAFAKTNGIDLRKPPLPILYYKLYKILKDEQHGTFNKYYEKLNTIPKNFQKIIALKSINSKNQLEFYIDIIREYDKENLTTKGLNFLLSIDYSYLEMFNQYDLDIIRLINPNVLHSDEQIFKLIEYATIDKELIPLLKGFSKIAPGSFLKSIDPRESIEDQIAMGGRIYEKDGKTYIDDGNETLRIYSPDQALIKIHNEYLDVKMSPKLNDRLKEFNYTLEKSNIPIINGNFEDYTFETHPLLVKDPITNKEIFNSELLVRGMIDKDCTSTFKGNHLLGWELIEQLVAYPEDNAYVVIKDPKGSEIASMYLTKVQDSIIIDSIQYMKDLRIIEERISYHLNDDEDMNDNIENHYHHSLFEVIKEWAYQCSSYKDSTIAPRKIYLGEGEDGLRLTKTMRDEISINIKDFSKFGKSKGKEKNFLTEITTPHQNSVYNDFDGGKTRLLYTNDPRLLIMKPVYNKMISNISKLPDFEKRKLNIDVSIKEMKKLEKERNNLGMKDYSIHGSIYQEEDSLNKDKVDDKFKNDSLFDIK